MKSSILLRHIFRLWLLTFVSIMLFSFRFEIKEMISRDNESGKKQLYENEVEESASAAMDLVNTEDESGQADLNAIKKRGKLVALTGYGPSNYFVYRGTPMGFEHDLLQLFAKELGVKLEIVIVKDMDELLEMLQRGEGDLIADNITVTKDLEEQVAFTVPLLTSRQVLIQRKPSHWRDMTHDKLEKCLIRSQLDLLGKKVHVRKGSAYCKRLLHLSEEIGGEINIVEESGEPTAEELIAMVSEGRIPYTVADENTALLHAGFYRNLDIKTPVSFEQRIAWAVRKDSPLLLKSVNRYISRVKKDGTLHMAYDKYYRARKGIDQMLRCTRDEMCGRNISPYDSLIMKHANRIGWDWRLLAALIYQESHFNPKAKSWAGACGLMQLMPGTANCFGAINPEDPEESLRAGTKYLAWLEKYWEKKVPDKVERIKFVIASYNVGQEHVADARRLAVKYHRDPAVWEDNVAYFLLNKSKEKYCTDPVVKYGYCRGAEPFHYVRNILDRYEHYKKLIKENV